MPSRYRRRPKSVAFEDRVERTRKVLQALYGDISYLPIIRPGIRYSALAGFWDIVLCPLAGAPPVLARVVPHTDDRPQGELKEAFGLAAEWLRGVYPEEVREGLGPCIVWIFGYIPSSTIPLQVGWLEKRDPSVLCGWKYNWSSERFENPDGNQYWIGKVARRVTIPAQWRSHPQRDQARISGIGRRRHWEDRRDAANRARERIAKEKAAREAED